MSALPQNMVVDDIDMIKIKVGTASLCRVRKTKNKGLQCKPKLERLSRSAMPTYAGRGSANVQLEVVAPRTPPRDYTTHMVGRGAV